MVDLRRKAEEHSPVLQLEERLAAPSAHAAPGHVPGLVTFGLPPNPVNSQQSKRTHMHFELVDCGGDMLSKQFSETARTLFRVAETMTDGSVAGQLRALAEDYERRAEKAAHGDAAKALARSAARAEPERATAE